MPQTDDKQDQTATVGTAQKTVDDDVNRIKAELDAKLAELESIKRAQSGSDRTVMQLKSELEEYKKKAMSDAQRLEYERQEREKELREKELEIKRREKQLMTKDFVLKHKLDARCESLLTAESAEGLEAQVVALNEIIKDAENRVHDEYKRRAATPGQGGTSTSTRTREDYPTVAARTKLFKENPDEYRRLFG